jgi:hypothetical protein
MEERKANEADDVIYSSEDGDMAIILQRLCAERLNAVHIGGIRMYYSI